MKIYTIGFTRKTAEEFFGLLKSGRHPAASRCPAEEFLTTRGLHKARRPGLLPAGAVQRRVRARAAACPDAGDPRRLPQAARRLGRVRAALPGADPRAEGGRAARARVVRDPDGVSCAASRQRAAVIADSLPSTWPNAGATSTSFTSEMRILVNHLTRMYGHYICAAALELETDATCALNQSPAALTAPATSRRTERGVLDLGAVVDLGPVRRTQATRPQLENVEFDAASCPRSCSSFDRLTSLGETRTRLARRRSTPFLVPN